MLVGGYRIDMEEQKEPRILRRIWFYLPMFFAIFFVGILIIRQHGLSFADDNMVSYQMNSGWKDAAGKTYALDKLPNGDQVLYRFLDDGQASGRRLCTKSRSCFFRVYADDQLIYDYHPKLAPIMGKSYGMEIHEIFIPAGTGKLMLEIEPIFTGSPASFFDTMLEDPSHYLVRVIRHGLPGFALCLIMFVFGSAFTIGGMLGKRKRGFISMGHFAAFIALWSVNDTFVLQVLLGNPQFFRMLKYMTFFLIPYFPVSFIWELTGEKKKWIRNTALIIVLIDLIANITLVYLGIMDYYEIENVNHVITLVTMALTFYMLFTSIGENRLKQRTLIGLTISIAVVAVGILADLARYHLKHANLQNSTSHTRVGVFFFLIIVGIGLIKDYNELMINTRDAQLMEELAYTDALTGLNNRMAFNEKERRLKETKQECIIVQLDINNLKQVNDVYGHAEGDRHIIGAADIIRSSFGMFGDCFRTGGDEFIVVIEQCGNWENAAKAVVHMKENVDLYNQKEKPPVMMSIAYGMSECPDASFGLEQAEIQADRLMYDCKSKMKQLEAGLES